jgi:hypothetical protein
MKIEKKDLLIMAFLCLAIVFGQTEAFSASYELAASKDTYARSTNPDTNYGNNTHFYIDSSGVTSCTLEWSSGPNWNADIHSPDHLFCPTIALSV